MLTESVAALIDRELDTLRREVEAYPDETTLWAVQPAVPNSGGVLVRHLCGNLQHCIGAVLGDSGYQRDRTAEFAAPPWPRTELLREIASTREAVATALARLPADQLAGLYPQTMGGARFVTGDFLVHLAVHLGYHLGQVDYHRRLATGGEPVGAMAIPRLATARPA